MNTPTDSIFASSLGRHQFISHCSLYQRPYVDDNPKLAEITRASRALTGDGHFPDKEVELQAVLESDQCVQREGHRGYEACGGTPKRVSSFSYIRSKNRV